MKTVYCYICGDILHSGHLLHLRNCKKLAGEDGILIAGVLSEKAISEKKSKPTLDIVERLNLIQSIKCVDLTVVQDTYSPAPNVLAIKPDILVESTSHNEEERREIESQVKSVGTKVITMPYFPMQSSSLIKNKIKGGK